MKSENFLKNLNENDMSGLLHAARNLNKSFIITAKLAEGGTKKFRVKAQSENVAKEKFSKHHSMAKIVDVKEEGIEEGKFTKNIFTGKKLHPRTGEELPDSPEDIRRQQEKQLNQLLKAKQKSTKENMPTLDQVWFKIEQVVSNTVPDGDPIDWLAPWLEKKGVHGFDIGKLLDKAAKKNGYKDLYDYYDDVKKQYHSYQDDEIDEAAKWRTHPDAHDYDTDGSMIPKTLGQHDPLSLRQGVSKTQSSKDPKSMAGKFGTKYATKHGVDTKKLMKNVPLSDIDEDDLHEGNEDRYKRNFMRRQHQHEWDLEQRAEQQRIDAENGTWYLRIDGKILKDKTTGQPVPFNGKRHAYNVAQKFIAKPFNDGKEIMMTMNPVDVPKTK